MWSLLALKVSEDALQDLCHTCLSGRIHGAITATTSTKVRAARVSWSVSYEHLSKCGANFSLFGTLELHEQSLERRGRCCRHALDLMGSLLTDCRLLHGLLDLDQVLVTLKVAKNAFKDVGNLVFCGGADFASTPASGAIAEGALVRVVGNGRHSQTCRMADGQEGTPYDDVRDHGCEREGKTLR